MLPPKFLYFVLTSENTNPFLTFELFTSRLIENIFFRPAKLHHANGQRFNQFFRFAYKRFTLLDLFGNEQQLCDPSFQRNARLQNGFLYRARFNRAVQMEQTDKLATGDTKNLRKIIELLTFNPHGL